MTDPEHNGHAGDSHAPNGADHAEEAAHKIDETVTMAATVGVVAVGAALWEVALLPGLALGVAAVLAPKYAPRMGAVMAPMLRSSVRGVYKFGQKTKEMVAEAKEQVHDIVAEVKAEDVAKPKADRPDA